MDFLHPEFLYLSPLVAVPVLIHLLNRIRYRVVRWAAIDFLLASERRAIRRARLRQILLMVLRTLLLAAAVLALAQPVFRGNVAALLGGSSQIAVAVDNSASMSAGDASGSALERAKHLASTTLTSLDGPTRAAGGTFAAEYACAFREPLQNRQTVASVLTEAGLTAGAGDVPRAICGAAETLGRGGGGGTIWLLTDMQSSGWQADKPGAWEQVRRALDEAGKPRIVITDLSAKVESNVSISEVQVHPSILMEGDRPRITATLSLQGSAAVTSVGLFLQGRQVDSLTVQFDSAGKKDVVFHLPELQGQALAGYLELSSDALPADDRCYFVVRATPSVPVLIVDGGPSVIPFEGAADFLSLAIQPPESSTIGRSLFSAKTISSQELGATPLEDYRAVLLADVAELEAAQLRRIEDFVSQGGLVMIFPGSRTQVQSWNEYDFAGVHMDPPVEAEPDKDITVDWTAPNNPIVGKLTTEGLERLMIRRMFRLQADASSEVLARTSQGMPFLVRRQIGKGKAYVFAVSCQGDFSNLPFTPVLLLTVHRAMLSHLLEHGEPLAHEAFAELRLKLSGGSYSIARPDGQVLPVRPVEGQPGRAVFSQTELSGIYRLIEGQAESEDAGIAIAAINVPASESLLEKIDQQTIGELLDGYSVSVVRASGANGQLSPSDNARIATSSFPLAALAIAFLLGEVLLAWSIGRSASRPVAKMAAGAPGETVNSTVEFARSG